MKKIAKIFKTLLVTLLLGVGVNAWGDDVASHNFDGQTTPFVISDANRLVASYDLQTGSETDYYAKYTCSNMNAVAFAYYDFSASVSDAATVTIDFDFNIATVAGHELISIADASVHTASGAGFTGKSNTGYGATGAIFNLGCFRGGGNNKFAINSTQNDYAGLDAWCHAQVVVDNANKKVSYIITKDAATLASADDIAFLNASANRCSQIDLYMGTNTAGNAIQIDNLVITKTVSEANHNYTINAMAGTTLLQELASGIANENAGYSVSVPKVISKDGKYYVLNSGQAGMTHCLAEFTMGTADEEKEIQYTLDESVIFFKECEEIQQSSELTTASGGYTCSYYANPVPVAISESGIYQLETNITGRDSNSSLEVYTADGTTAVAAFAKNCGTGVKTLEFFASGNMRVGGPYYNDKFNNSKSVDYILIRKIISNVSAAIGASGYATFASDYALDFSAATGVKAYYASAVEGGKVIMSKVNGAVAVGTGLFLQKTEGEISIPVAANGDELSTNLFVRGGDAAVTKADGYDQYVLGASGESVAFFLINGDAPTVAKDKAYLKVPTGAGTRLSIVFGDEDTTGIQTVEKTVNDNVVYDLQGRRVAAPQKGLYIVNGKKVIK